MTQVQSAATVPGYAEAMARIAELEKQNAALKAGQATRGLSFKVSEKGCVSIYGMNIRGVHLYAAQWLKVIDNADKIKAFIQQNKDLLNWKNEADKAAI